MSKNEGISWNANQPFYEHLRAQVWDRVTEADKNMAIAEGEDKGNAMEIKYGALMHWFDMIYFYLTDAERTKIQAIFDKINDQSNGVEFSMLTDNRVLTDILIKMRELNRALWSATATYGMLPTKRDTTGVSVFE